MASKIKKGKDQDDPDKTANSAQEQIPDPEGYNTENYQCMRNATDGSMYYGEVGYMKRGTGQVIKFGSEAYTEHIKTLTEEQRLQTYETVRHGYGLQLFNGSRNPDGVLTKYEGHWDRSMKQGEGFAVYEDGSTFRGKFKKDVMEGQGTFTWAQGNEYRGNFRAGQMDGKGCFRHANGNGKVLEGNFCRNQFEKENVFVNPLEEEHQHDKVIKRLVGIAQEKAQALLEFQAQQEAEQEAQRQLEMQAEMEIQKTIGSTQHFEEGEVHGMGDDGMGGVGPDHLEQQQEEEF